MVLCRSSVSLLIFFGGVGNLVLSPAEKLVLKFPTIIAELSISIFGSFSFCFVYFETLLLSMWIFMTCLPAELSL